jgi:DNA-binding NarL/FixJ family response regulator
MGSDSHLRIRVLIVDDHPLIRRGLRCFFELEGLEVVGEASTGVEALELVRATDPDVVMLDLQMPDMGGLEVTRLIKEQAPRTAVLIYTGYGQPETMRAALLAGAAGYLTKGMSGQAICDAVQAVRSGGAIVDPYLLDSLVRTANQESGDAADIRAKIQSLTPRERQVLALIVDGLRNAEIAFQIHFSLGTVKNTVQRIIEKLEVSDRAQAALLAARGGAIPD